MSSWQTIQDYPFRSFGFGERPLPDPISRSASKFTLTGSGLIWNIYFGVLAPCIGFFIATSVAVGKNSASTPIRKASEWFVFIFRGSPLFIQFSLPISCFYS